MDIEKFTERTRGFLQAAADHCDFWVSPADYARACAESLARRRRGRGCGVDQGCGRQPAELRWPAVEADLARMPKVLGLPARARRRSRRRWCEIFWTPRSRPLRRRPGDEYVAQDRLLVALAASDAPAAGPGSAQAGWRQPLRAIEKAVNDVRKGRKVN